MRGSAPRSAAPELDAAITFGDLEQIFRIRGVNVLSQPTFFERVPEERRRHLSTAGGLPLALLEEARWTNRRFRKLRGLDALTAVARAVAVDRHGPRLRGHPVERGVAGPPAVGAAGGAVLAPGAAGQHRAAAEPGAGGGHGAWWRASGATFVIKARGRSGADPAAVAADPEADRHWVPTGGPGTAGPAASIPASGSPRRRRWAGRRSGSARPTRSAGRTRPSGRRRWTP